MKNKTFHIKTFIIFYFIGCPTLAECYCPILSNMLRETGTVTKLYFFFKKMEQINLHIIA